MIIKLASGKEINITTSTFLLDLTSEEFKELVFRCKQANTSPEKEAA